MNILETHFYRNLDMPVEDHKHTFYELHYITAGTTELYSGGARYPIKPGVFFWTKPGERHFLKINRKMKPISQYTFNVELSYDDSDLQAALTKKFYTNRVPLIGSGHQAELEMIRNYHLSSNNLKKSVAIHRMYAFLYQFAINTSCTAPADNQYIQSAIQIMHSEYPSPLNMDDICQQLGISYSYFSRLFKEEMGESPFRYYLAMRLENARYMLQNSRMKIKDIAEETGFSDSLYFSRLFRKWYGQSPSQWAETD